MTLPRYATETNIGETQATVALLVIDIAEGGLPAAIREADGMPDDAVPAKASDMQPTGCSSCTTNIDKAQATVALLVIDIAEEGHPAAIREADGVPNDAGPVKASDMQHHLCLHHPHR